MQKDSQGGRIDVVCPDCGIIGVIQYYKGIVIKGMMCPCGSVAISTNNGVHHHVPSVPVPQSRVRTLDDYCDT